ncbi:MAG: DUF1015 domain-containing protein [Candidatus Acidiferrales bacterium]
MAEIQPFRAFRYDTGKVKLADVLTQPYDKISAAMQEKYYAASPFNLISVEKGKVFADDTIANSVYSRAAKKMEEWIAQKVLVQDAAPGIYVYTQEFTVPGTQTRRARMGFIALGRLEDYEAKVVHRHERTLPAPKADRIELQRQTRAQTGQLFMLYDDPARKIEILLEEITRKPAPAELIDEYGVTHRLWPVTDAALIERVQKEMAGQKLVIADGHHRYETALHLRNEARKLRGQAQPMAVEEFAMMTFVNTHSRGLTILPAHRLLLNRANFDFEKFRNAVSPWFDWYSYPFVNHDERAAACGEFLRDLDSDKHHRRAIGIYAGGSAFYLFLLRRDADLGSLLPDISDAQRGLDVVLLHRLILEKGLGITPEAVAAEKSVGYEREIGVALAAVDQGGAQMAMLMKAVRVQQVMDIALGGDVMPQKSTDFYPKLMSGIAIFRPVGNVESVLAGRAEGTARG